MRKKELQIFFGTLFTIVIFVISFFEEPSKELEVKNTHTKTKQNEKYYQTIMCNELSGKIEYILKDRTRVDCLTNDYAIEVDWAKKWAEGVGQSLYYAEMTNKKPAVALIVGNNDQKYIKRVEVLSKKLNIKLILLEK